MEVVRKEIVGENAWNHDHEGDDKLEKGGEDNAPLAFGEGFGAESALDDVLVEAPIKEVWNPEPQQESRPRDVGVLQWSHHVELATRAIGAVSHQSLAVAPVVQEPEAVPGPGVLEVLHGGLRIGDLRGDEGFRWGVSKGLHGQPHDDCAAKDKPRSPDEIGPCAGLETTRKNIGRREDSDEPATGHQIPQDRQTRVISRDELRTAENDGCGRDHHQHKYCQKCHDDACREAEAVFEEFRNRVNSGAQKPRKEEKCHQHQRDRRHPLIRRYGHAKPICGRAGHSHKLLGGDIGRDEGEAHQPPGEAPTGKKVAARTALLGAAFIAGLPDAKRDHTNNGDGKEGEFKDQIHGIYERLGKFEDALLSQKFSGVSRKMP